MSTSIGYRSRREIIQEIRVYIPHFYVFPATENLDESAVAKRLSKKLMT